MLGEHIIVDGLPEFVRLSKPGVVGTPPSPETLDLTDCPNTGKPCTWLQGLVELGHEEEICPPLSEAELRTIQEKMSGHECLLIDSGNDSQESQCAVTVLPDQLGAAADVIFAREDAE